MTATRTIDGIDLPAPGTWTVDPGHADIAFIGRHFMLTKVRGRFTGIEAVVHIGDRPEESFINATIDMASVHSGDQARDDHLRSADFFDVEHWPQATFRSNAISWHRRRGSVTGDLTIKDVTRQLTLEIEYLGHVTDPWGGERAVFEASGRINREDWGLTWNMILETGGVVVSKEIALEFHVELVQENPEPGGQRD